MANKEASGGGIAKYNFWVHMIIVFEYDINSLKNHIEKYCLKFIENDWQSLANKLSKIGKWEFEDYH